jgi:tRNA dimethylallyltransferase
MTIDAARLLVIVTGPTASGKTGVSIRLAQHFQSCIVSADSRQFFREMRIGTARPSEEELNAVPHHFIGHLSVTDDYNIARFEQDALKLLDGLFLRNPILFMTGGSMLYIDAVCNGIDAMPDPEPGLREKLMKIKEDEGIAGLQSRLKELDPVYYREVDLNNPARLSRAIEVCLTTGMPYSNLRKNEPAERNFRILKIGLKTRRADLIERIDRRVDAMIEAGLEREARELYPFRHRNALATVGYQEMFDWFDGKITRDEAIEKIKINTRRYAKRQMTWYKRDHQIHWLEPGDFEEMVSLIRNYELRITNRILQ